MSGMADFWRRMRRRKLVQWALAYVAGAFALLQGVDIVAQQFGWPEGLQRGITLALVLGFLVTLVLAWYHGERGAQNVGGTELLVLALLLAVGGGLLWRFTGVSPVAGSERAVPAAPESVPATTAPPAKSIAVLPFENLSRDPDNEYFVAGMQDLILTRLAGIGDLKVISRTSTEQYASHPENLKQIAQELGVAHIVEGSVQKVGNDVLISVQLVDARTDHHIWAESYQRTLDNIFGVEGEVAGRIAAALRANLTAYEVSAVAQVPTTNPQAYDYYLHGLNFMRLATKGDWAGNVPQAIAAFKRAAAEDPDFALAWAWSSIARAVARYADVDQSEANLQASEVEATRALALAPRLPEAHRAMGHVQRFVHHDFAAARDEFQRAVDLRPNDADAVGSLAIVELWLGNHDAGINSLRRAIALDPQDSMEHWRLGNVLAESGDYADARRAQRRALVIDPQNVQAYIALSDLEIQQNGDVDAAIRVLDQGAPGTPVNAHVAWQRIRLLLYRRQFSAARAMAEQYADTFTTGPAAIEMTFARARVEWVAGETADARAFYRTGVNLVTRSGNDIMPRDRMRLSVAYARLGDGKAAMREFAAAKADLRRSHADVGEETHLWVLAQIRLAMDQKAAAIDALRKVGRNASTWLRFDPLWDPIRDDPRFQALLEEHADAAPVAASTAPATQE